MVHIRDVDAQSSELANEFFDLLLNRVPSHVPKILIFVSLNNLVDCPGQAIGYCHFGSVCRSKPGLKLAVFGSVVGAMFLFSSVCRLDQDFSQVWVALAAF